MPPNPATTGGWKVVSQEDTLGVDPIGRAVEGIKVHFQTDRGVTSSVFVPKAMYSPDNVRAAIKEAVAAIHVVADMKG